jgi:hypothetical protein
LEAAGGHRVQSEFGGCWEWGGTHSTVAVVSGKDWRLLGGTLEHTRMEAAGGEAH